jgi:hypothetical protein
MPDHSFFSSIVMTRKVFLTNGFHLFNEFATGQIALSIPPDAGLTGGGQ